MSSLAGVVSVRAVATADGQLEEIHVLSTAELHPKQVVRNVESALSAGLGLEVDRRIVSVAQVREADYAGSELALPAEGSDAPSSARERFVLARYDTRTVGAQETHCRVVLRRGEAEYSGAGEGANTVQGRAQAAARALFAALAASRGRDDLALEGATLVEALGRTFVLVAAHAIEGRQTVPLTGAAALGRSPEEAALLASLQATNRWAELPA